MTRILGIDPGSRLTGYGLIDCREQHARYVASGCLQVAGDSLPDRLGLIFRELSQLIEQFRPQQFAIESVFMHRNADSALKLGQARGAAICAAVMGELPVSEYAPREIKQSVVGRGGADKRQVQHMVRVLLNLNDTPQADAADALAVALCHSYRRQALERVGDVRRLRGGRLR
ncbi:MAG TPA: crossover junction endodeoxyribonuclease RuvC [Gammaproteobacteria bacterium]|nr:crossover junction endodeoxyribonuclease RuvC [Gammaproteobacteria bacterium]